MVPVSTKEGGLSAATGPDVCLVPPGVPTPFPNTGGCADAIGGTCTQRVKVRNKAVIVEGSQLASSAGDEGGVGTGVVSGTVAHLVTYKQGSETVIFEGRKGEGLGSMTAHNGPNANQPVGQQTAPSQGTVFLKL